MHGREVGEYACAYLLSWYTHGKKVGIEVGEQMNIVSHVSQSLLKHLRRTFIELGRAKESPLRAALCAWWSLLHAKYK